MKRGRLRRLDRSPSSIAVEAALERLGARRRAGRPAARRCATACSTAASGCARCSCWPPREAVHGAARGGAARRLRGRADPRLFAGPRRHAVHGQRRAAPRQADRARAVRRGPGDARRRRDAGAGVRGPDARRRRRRAGAAGAAVRAAGARGRRAPAWPAARRSTWPASACRSTSSALRDMHRRKTGALLQASVLMGAACGDADAGRVAGAGRLRRRASAWRSRSSTTSSTSRRPPRRSARPPARTCDNNKPTYVTRARPRAGARATPHELRDQAHAALARSGLRRRCAPAACWPTGSSSATQLNDMPMNHTRCSTPIDSPADLRRLSRTRAQAAGRRAARLRAAERLARPAATCRRTSARSS